MNISVNVHHDEPTLQACCTSHYFVINDKKQRIFNASKKQLIKEKNALKQQTVYISN